jgi:hypothetical protein
MRRVPTPKQRLWVISTLLIALVVRALIPAGFMPATDRPFSFQVCPDGFPAELLGDARKALPPGEDGAAEPAGHPHHDGMAADAGALAHAGHHHALANATSGSDGTPALAHHQDAGDMPGLAHHHDVSDMPGLTHHHDAPPGHNHSSASAEHCVFAAAAGAFALAFAATFSAPAATISAPDVAYVSPAFESHRYRLPQPRGPPALS